MTRLILILLLSVSVIGCGNPTTALNPATSQSQRYAGTITSCDPSGNLLSQSVIILWLSPTKDSLNGWYEILTDSNLADSIRSFVGPVEMDIAGSQVCDNERFSSGMSIPVVNNSSRLHPVGRIALSDRRDSLWMTDYILTSQINVLSTCTAVCSLQ